MHYTIALTAAHAAVLPPAEPPGQARRIPVSIDAPQPLPDGNLRVLPQVSVPPQMIAGVMLSGAAVPPRIGSGTSSLHAGLLP